MDTGDLYYYSRAVIFSFVSTCNLQMVLRAEAWVSIARDGGRLGSSLAIAKHIFITPVNGDHYISSFPADPLIWPSHYGTS